MKKFIFFLIILHCTLFMENCFCQWAQMSNGIGTNQSIAGLEAIGTSIFACSNTGSGVYISTNNGLSWNATNNGLNTTVYTIANFGANLFAGTQGGTYISSNMGSNWNGPYGYAAVSFVSISTNIFGGTWGSGAVISSNNGLNWTTINNGLTILLIRLAKNGSVLYAASYGGGAFFSTNNGGTWNAIDSGLTNLTVNTIYSNGNKLFAGTTSGIFISTNNGGFWYQGGLSNRNIITYALNGNILYAGSDSGIYISINNGVNWIVKNQGFTAIPVIQTFLVAGNYSYVGTTTQSVWRRPNSDFPIPPVVVLNSIYKPNEGSYQISNLTLSDSLCSGQLDSIYWFVNDSLVGRQHTLIYPFRQGTAKVKLKINNFFGNSDSSSVTVTRISWKKYTSGQIYAGLSLIGDSILYAVSTNDAVYRMDINGNIIYPLTVGGSVLSSCSIAFDTSVYITSTDGNLYGFKSDGSNIWPPIPLGSQASATPTIDSISNRLYIGIANGFFKAINRNNGYGAWSYFCNAPVKSSAVISFQRKLAFASSIGTVYGFNLNNSNPSPPNWTLNLNDSVLVSPCVDTSGNFYFGSRTGKIYKVALTGTNTSTILWQIQLDSAVTSSPTIDANGNIYVGTKSGRLYSINRNGGIRWFFQSPGQIKSTAAITPSQRVYFGNDAGEIYGLDTNKIIRFYYVDSAKISCAMLYNKGTLYFGNEAGRLFALYDTTAETYNKIGNGTPIWGTFQNNVRRTGEQDNVISPPISPILLSPLNGTTGLSLTPLLDWSDAPFATSYRIQISKSILFGTTVYDTSGVNTSQVTVSAGKLGYDTLYYWRVYSQNSSGISTWSSVWNFTTANSTPPPQLISPLNLTTLVPLTPLMYWCTVPSATCYRIQISNNPGFTSTLIDSIVYMTGLMIPSGILGSVTTYYWRVASISPIGQGNYSAPWSFTTRNNLILNLTVLLEGFWDGASMISDTVRVYIANPVSPYNFVDSANVILSTTGTATAIFNIPPNGNYYVVIMHRNHLETWSSLAQTFMTDVPVNYNFTTSSSQAYGNNMKQVGSVWVLYGGDPNQDGSIDGLDIPIFISQFGTQGYLSCDFNGDGDVNALDVQIIVSNFGLTKATPTLEPVRRNENGKKENGKTENGKIVKQKIVMRKIIRNF